MVVKFAGCIMEIKVTPIRKNQGLGKATSHSASVVIGGSMPDIIEETPENIAEMPEIVVEKAEKTAKKAEKTVKKPKKAEKTAKKPTEKTKVQPSGNQVATKKKPIVRERVTFSPNKHIKLIIKRINQRYGTMGKSEFINTAIEKEWNYRMRDSAPE